MDLEEMMDAAVENDTRLKVLTTILENTLLAIDRAQLAPGRNFEFSTGDIQTAYSFNPRAGDPEWLISFEPSASLFLGRKKETQISAEVPVAVGVDTGEFTVLPSVAIRQPLDKLFNGEKLTEAQELQNRFTAEKARIDIVKRVKEVEQALFEQLSQITVLKQQAIQLKHNLSSAKDARQQALTLGTFTPGSSQEKHLEFTVNQLERRLQLQQRKEDLVWKELERIVGKPVEKLPDRFPVVTLELPDIAFVEKNPQVYLAVLAVEVEKVRLEEKQKPAEPEFFIGSALGTTLDEDTEETTTKLAGTVEGEFEDFKFTAGVGGILETGTLFATFGFSWSFPDKQIEDINIREQENFVDISRLNEVSARQAFLQTRELLALDLADLDYRSKNLAEQRTLAALELEEGIKRHQAGLITDEELDKLRWQSEQLNYDMQILQLDQLQIASRLDALVALETNIE
jgi:hypothetical protein